jgi:hypothetical protein
MTTRPEIVESAETRERNARWSEWEAASVASERKARTRIVLLFATIISVTVAAAAGLVFLLQ